MQSLTRLGHCQLLPGRVGRSCRSAGEDVSEQGGGIKYKGHTILNEIVLEVFVWFQVCVRLDETAGSLMWLFVEDTKLELDVGGGGR